MIVRASMQVRFAGRTREREATGLAEGVARLVVTGGFYRWVETERVGEAEMRAALGKALAAVGVEGGEVGGRAVVVREVARARHGRGQAGLVVDVLMVVGGVRAGEAGGGRREAGAGSRAGEPGAGSREPGTGSREAGAGRRETGGAGDGNGDVAGRDAEVPERLLRAAQAALRDRGRCEREMAEAVAAVERLVAQVEAGLRGELPVESVSVEVERGVARGWARERLDGLPAAAAAWVLAAAQVAEAAGGWLDVVPPDGGGDFDAGPAPDGGGHFDAGTGDVGGGSFGA